MAGEMMCRSPRFYANLYAVLAVLLSVALLFYYPSMRALHESAHYLRGLSASPMYQSGRLPASVLDFTAQMHAQHEGESLFSTIPAVLRDMTLEPDKRIAFVPDSNVMVYCWINYLPQMAAGTIGWLLSLSPFALWQLSRTFCLLAGIVSGYVILRLLPRWHVPVLLSLMLPSLWVMRLQQYTDQWVFIAALACVALIVRCTLNEQPVRRARIAVMAGLGGLIGLTKMVYAPLVLAFMLLPRRLYAGPWQRLRAVALIVAVTLGASLGSTWIAYRADYVEQINFPYFQDNSLTPAQKAAWVDKKRKDKEQVVAILIQEPLKVLAQAWGMYTEVAFWQRNGRELWVWYMNPYPNALAPLGLWPLLLLLLFVGEAGSWAPSAAGRLWLATLLVAVLMLLALALHTGGAGGMQRIQGRYFAPLLPFAGLISCVRLPGRWIGVVLWLQLALGLGLLLLMYLAVFGLASGHVYVF